MPRLPRVTAAEMLRVARRAGFEVVRQSGSHMILRDPTGKRLTIGAHAGRILHPKVVANILSDAGWSVDQFISMLRDV